MAETGRKKKKIIINGRFLGRDVTGVERYAREIIAGLDAVAEKGELELAIPPEVDREQVPRLHNIRVVRTGRLPNRLWEHISFPRYVRRRDGISLNLCNTAPLPDPGIVCICDMKFRAHPEFFSRKFRLWYRLLMRNETARARHILTISEFSKREIMKYYKVSPERISVISCGWQHMERIREDEAALKKYGLEEGGYCFAMSSLEPNKNMNWIRRAAQASPELIFAVAGKANPEIFAAAPKPERAGSGMIRQLLPRKAGQTAMRRSSPTQGSTSSTTQTPSAADQPSMSSSLPSNIRLLGYVSDGEAKALMHHCRAFLYPSFYEGFGMPPLEALSAGAETILVSDTEVMHEVFGDTAVYIDPWGDGKELRSLLEKESGEAFVKADGNVSGNVSGKAPAEDIIKADGKAAGNVSGKAPESPLNRYSWQASATKLYQMLHSSWFLRILQAYR